MSRRAALALVPERRNQPAHPMLRALLPWEDADEFEADRMSLHAEHQPNGPTETALVDQIAWILWRRRRLEAGERAAHLAGLQDRLSADHKTLETVRRATLTFVKKAGKEELAPALSSSSSGDEQERIEAEADEAMTQRAIAVLTTGDPAAYDEALAELRADTASWWEDVVADDEQTHPDGQPRDGESYQPYSRTAAQLLRFLETDVMPQLEETTAQLVRRPAVRLQAHGESLDPFRMERILALDERLTRQFEKALVILLRLQERRQVIRTKGSDA